MFRMFLSHSLPLLRLDCNADEVYFEREKQSTYISGGTCPRGRIKVRQATKALDSASAE
jgi:hypothetical protein